MKSRNRPKFLPILAFALMALLYWTRRKRSVPAWAESPTVTKKPWDPKSDPFPPIVSRNPLLEKPGSYGSVHSAGISITNGDDPVVVETIDELPSFEVSESEAAGEAASDDGWIDAGDAHVCPPGFPIKGNASSLIYHLPGQSSYEATIPEICFSSEEAAALLGYRPRKR